MTDDAPVRRWGVVIVNYNAAQLALDAALSVLGDAPDAQIVIVDNASTNNSLDVFSDAFESGERITITPPGLDSAFKPHFADLCDIEAAIIECGETSGPHLERLGRENAFALTVLRAPQNNGFAAGSNIGLRYLKARGGHSHYLLLNPDALVAPGALERLARVLEDKEIGLCGATVLRANTPARVQALGGAALNPVTLTGSNLGEDAIFPLIPERSAIEPQIMYPLGAAIALRPDYLENVGFLDERYFLYYEEADWALSGRGRYRCGWARDAVVFHHYGASSHSAFRSAGEPSQRSLLSEYHMARSRLLFALKWRPWLAPLTVAIAGLQALRRVFRGRADAARALIKGAVPGAPRLYVAPPV